MTAITIAATTIVIRSMINSAESVRKKLRRRLEKNSFAIWFKAQKNIFMKEIFFRSYYRICYQRLMREASSMLIGFLGQRILLRICFIFQEQILRWQALHRKHWLNWRTERFIRFQWQERDQEEEMRRKIKRWKKNCWMPSTLPVLAPRALAVPPPAWALPLSKSPPT